MTEPVVVSSEVKAEEAKVDSSKKAESTVDNKLKTLTFFSDLAGRLAAISQESVPGSSTVLNMAKAGLVVAFSEFKGDVDTLNTTTDGQTPLQNIVDDKKIKQLTDALQAAMISIPKIATSGSTTPESQKPKVGILQNFVDSINGIAITDPKTLDFLERIVNELDTTFKNLESVEEIKTEMIYVIAPVIAKKILPSYNGKIPSVLNPVVNAILSPTGLTVTLRPLLWTFSIFILPIIRGQFKKLLGLTAKEAEEISTDSYASLLQSTVGLFLAPLRKKIADDRALISGNLSWEKINNKIDSLEGSIAAAKKKIEEQISKIESQQAPEDMTAQILEMATQAKELEELVQKRAEPEKVKLETTKKDLNGFLSRVKEFPDPVARDSLLGFIAEIEKTFPNEPSLSKVIEKIKGELAEGPAPQPPGWGGWLVGGAMAMVGWGAGDIQTSLTELKDSLAKIVPKTIDENQKVIDLSTAVKAKASAIVEETNKLVELESKKQKKAITADLNKVYDEQLKILNSLGEKISDLKQRIDRYQDGYFKFFHKFFGTERYRVHNVLEALEATVMATSGVDADAHKVLEAQEKLGEALGKLDKTQQVPITGTERIKDALKAYEKLEESRPKRPTVESLPNPSEQAATLPPKAVTPEKLAKEDDAAAEKKSTKTP
jgi:hypothetical protein